MKALDEIYKIYTLMHLSNPMNLNTMKNAPGPGNLHPGEKLHRSEFKNSAKFRQTISHFCNFTFKNVLIYHFLKLILIFSNFINFL